MTNDRNPDGSSADDKARRVRRMTNEETSSYKEKRQQREDEANNPDSEGRGRDRDDRRSQRPRQDKQANVSLFLGPRLYELAEDKPRWLKNQCGITSKTS